MMRTNDHITDLDAIELSSGWNYNSKLETGKNALLSDSLLRDIKVLSSNAKGDADMRNRTSCCNKLNVSKRR